MRCWLLLELRVDILHDVCGGYLPTEFGKLELPELSRGILPADLNGSDDIVELRQLCTWDVLERSRRQRLRPVLSRSICLVRRSSCMFELFGWDVPSLHRVELLLFMPCGDFSGDSFLKLLFTVRSGCVLWDCGALECFWKLRCWAIFNGRVE